LHHPKAAEEAVNSTTFIPILVSACGALGVAFLKGVYGRAKEVDKFLMSQQPALKQTWNTTVASSFLGMRLSTLNFPVVAQQPHPDPNHAAHSAARLFAVALRTNQN